MLSVEQFKKLFPNCKNPDEWVKEMLSSFEKYKINTPKRVASFLAQCGHESGGWRVFEENLNYSEKALNAVFPKYFERAGRDASKYARQPEKIANVVYANRMGNGDSKSGEGWLYRGRGPIQLTGKDNYRNFARDVNLLNKPIEIIPELIEKNVGTSLLTALWFWDKNDLNSYADKSDIKGQTKRINGGYNGLEDRMDYYKKTLILILTNMGTVGMGSTGDNVKVIQEYLGITEDGDFGPKTEEALKEFQIRNGLTPDGVAGPETIKVLVCQ